MLTRTRHHVAAPDPSVPGKQAPHAGWRRFSLRAAQLLFGAVITGGLIGTSPAAGPALAAAQPPIGYERWTNPDADSGVDFGLTAKQVFQMYADQLVIGLPLPAPAKDTRLIDIEIRADRSGLANYVYDVVWVKNAGSLALDSWFVPGMTEAELHTLPQLASQGIVALDLERYPDGDEWRYSVILQRNAGKFGWDVLTDASLDEVLDTATRRGMRVLDLDYAIPGPLECTVPGQACSPATFDAILVANSGNNAVETRVWLNMNPTQIADKEAQGFQMIDREGEGDGVLTVWVKAGLPFDVLDGLSETEVIHEHGHHGRVIDLEGTPNAFSIVRFAGSAAPASPGLADAHQDADDDGRHQTKHRDGKANGKAEHNSNAKAKNGGKRGKHGKGRGR